MKGRNLCFQYVFQYINLILKESSSFLFIYHSNYSGILTFLFSDVSPVSFTSCPVPLF